ncbi:MAG: hypothetical protein WC969_15540, partial [Elusimicrobiota bacterium]
MNTLHSRIAAALNWTAEDAQSLSLQALRELVRPVDAALADEISRTIESGEVLRRPVSRCRCGRVLPEVAAGATPYEFCSEACKRALAPKPAKPTPRLVCAIARDIRKDWGVKINYAAQPYLNAMLEAETIHDD